MLKLYWKIIRPNNLGLTLFTQILFYLSASRYTSGISGFDLSNIRIPEAITATLACVFVAAGGYVINDIFDKETDAINKPDKQIAHALLSTKSLYPYYYILSSLGIVLGFFTGIGMGILCLAIATLLYFYSSDFKGEYLMGNLMVALMSGMVVYISTRGVFQVSKAFFAEYASIAFFLTFARELIKDLEDIEGDKAQGFTTFAISNNPKTTKLLSLTMLGIAIGILGIIYYHSRETLFLVASVIITLPFTIFITRDTLKAQNPSDYHRVSTRMKQLMFWGLFTSLFC
jgi:4-hydroxybenzoate polyprenyltransferase